MSAAPVSAVDVADFMDTVEPAVTPPAILPLPAVAITVDRKDFVRRLKMLFKATERHSRLPVLSHVCVCEVAGAGMMLATDLDITMGVSLGAMLPEGAQFLIPPAVLKFLSKDTGETAQIGYDDNVLRVGTARFPSIDAREFPLDSQSCKVLRGVAQNDPLEAKFRYAPSFESLLCAVSQDETRFNLAGVHLDVEAHRLVATDGHRLHMVDVRGVSGDPKKSWIIPAKALRLLEAAKPKREDVELHFANRRIWGASGEYRIACEEPAAEFPDYRQVLPKDYEITARIERKAVLALLERSAAFRTERARGGIKVKLDALGVVFTCSNPGLGTFTERLDCETKGAAITGFNGRYLVDMFESCTSDTVTLEVKDEFSPAQVRDGDLTCIVMPMRL